MKTKTTRDVILSLPAECFGVLPIDHTLIRIKAGEIGYYATLHGSPLQRLILPGETADQAADRLNAEHGTTKAQRRAMQVGSIFGWDCPAADPENYNEDGTDNKEKMLAAIAA